LLPFVADESIFALEGGTAINFFVRDMPRLSGARLTLVPQGDDMEVKVHCQRGGRARVKVEVNPLQRGALWPVRKLACTDAVQEAFESFVELPVVSHAELFGGKVSAALDRQHPRDLFDVRQLLDVEGFGAAPTGRCFPRRVLKGSPPRDGSCSTSRNFAPTIRRSTRPR
jgi:hypothetical protein